MRIVYIAHPIASDDQFTTEQNIADLIRIIRKLNLGDCPESDMTVPMAPYIGDCLALQDDNPMHRRRGIENDIAMIETGIFEEIWLTGHKLSLGMAEEVKMFVLQGKRVVDLIGKI